MTENKGIDMDLDFEKCGGLIPAIAQDAESGKILMLAYINKEAFEYTLKTGKATYWSRSRNKLWCKGEESGNFQEIVDILVDCDNDTVIYKVNQKGLGAACHTGYESCFYRTLVNGKWEYNGEIKKFDEQKVYKK
jgi:phosphoribosyl-AMP cyclohydrolase